MSFMVMVDPVLAEPLLGALPVDLPTGLNAGWLVAASGIGFMRAAQHGPSAPSQHPLAPSHSARASELAEGRQAVDAVAQPLHPAHLRPSPLTD